MASLRGRNGDGQPPPDDGGLPDLPPEWGVVVIPDDPSELDRESSVLRRQRRRTARRDRWRHRLGLEPVVGDSPPPVGAPLLIMVIAIIAALTSLFALTMSTHAGTGSTGQQTNTVIATPTQQMIDLSLYARDGTEVRLRETLPAVILLLDGCTCEQLIRDTAAATPARVTVLVIDRAAPVLPSGVTATSLADPEQALLATYADGADRAAKPNGPAVAVLVGPDGAVTRTANPARNIGDFRNDLIALGRMG